MSNKTALYRPKNIRNIIHSFYINLSHRTDRRKHVETQLSSIGITPSRFGAIYDDNGAIGCTKSHLSCLKTALRNNWSHVMICEDDITFLNPELFIDSLNNILANYDNWDVILLGGNNLQPFRQLDSSCIHVGRCLTTTGYIVNNHYFSTIINNINTGLTMLQQYPTLKYLYAIDTHWLSLQRKHKWYLVYPLTVVQLDGYSDIEKKDVNYTSLMESLI